MNKMQRRAALDSVEQSNNSGTVYAMASLTIAGKKFFPGQRVCNASEMESWAPANKRALLGNRLVEIRRA